MKSHISLLLGFVPALLSGELSAQTPTQMVPVLATDERPPDIGSLLQSSGIRNRVSSFSSSEGSSGTPDTNSGTPVQITCPTDKAGLTDGFDTFAYSLNRNAAFQLNLYGSASLNASDRVVLYQFMWYKDVQDTTGTTLGRCGAGISLSLRVRNLQGSVSTSLPFLAASAQLGLAEVEYRLTTVGLSGTGVDAALPPASRIGSFNAESYAALLTTIDRIQATVGSTTTASTVSFTPKVIAVASDSPVVEFPVQVAVQALALAQISRGTRCTEAKTSVPSRSSASDEQIEELYRAVVGRTACTANTEPDTTIRNRARALMTAHHLKWD